MRVTIDRDKKLTLIYIYIREFDGIIVNTIPDVRAELIFDKYDNWIGVEVFSITSDDNKIKLPILKKQYKTIKNEIFLQEEVKLSILFDADIPENYRKKVLCNIDYNKVNGFQGLELILAFDVKTEIV